MMSESHEKSIRSSYQAATGTAAKMKKQAVDTAENVKNKAADMAEAAANTIQEQRDRVGAALDQTAYVIRERREKLASVAQRAADRLQSTADYLREHDANAMADDVKTLIRRHPGPWLAAAAFTGFMLARLLKSDD
jgi:ElaB/YqjD/DUF883 family membrane-anchored ribosome-binding protein